MPDELILTSADAASAPGASFNPVVVPPPVAGRDQSFNVHFDSSGNAVTIAFHARSDVDYDRKSIRIAIDGDSLPDGWYLGSGASSLDITISDAQTRQFFFVGRRTIRDGLNPRLIPNVISYDNMKQGDYVDIEIQVRPPYPPGESVFLFPSSLSNDLGRIFAGNARVLECLYRSVRLDAVSLAVVCHYPVATAGNSWKLGGLTINTEWLESAQTHLSTLQEFSQ